jgi:hypothetical protein
MPDVNDAGGVVGADDVVVGVDGEITEARSVGRISWVDAVGMGTDPPPATATVCAPNRDLSNSSIAAL